MQRAEFAEASLKMVLPQSRVSPVVASLPAPLLDAVPSSTDHPTMNRQALRIAILTMMLAFAAVTRT